MALSADVSDPAIAEAVYDVKNDKSDTNWCAGRWRGPAAAGR